MPPARHRLFIIISVGAGRRKSAEQSCRSDYFSYFLRITVHFHTVLICSQLTTRWSHLSSMQNFYTRQDSLADLRNSVRSRLSVSTKSEDSSDFRASILPTFVLTLRRVSLTVIAAEAHVQLQRMLHRSLLQRLHARC